MQGFEVSAVACQNRSVDTRGKGKLVGIANSLVRTSSLVSCDDVVPKLA